MSLRLYIVLLCLVAFTSAAPNWNRNRNGNSRRNNGNRNGGAQGKQLQANGGGDTQNMFMPYDFQWAVDDEESGNYYGHQEKAENNRVDGSYHVWLPDGRLMKVEYYVDGNSGFVPKITYEKGYTPTWGSLPYRR